MQVVHVIGPGGPSQRFEFQFGDRDTPAAILRQLQTQKKTFGRVGSVVRPDPSWGRVIRNIHTSFPDPDSPYVLDDPRTVVAIGVVTNGGRDFTETKRLQGPPVEPPAPSPEELAEVAAPPEPADIATTPSTDTPE